MSNVKFQMLNAKGQVVLILILVMTVALGIGVSVVQRSLSDVSTASKVEQSSRAFSAAEAGIEKALQSRTANSFPLDSNYASTTLDALPATGQALEYPAIAKEEMAQVWLADPTSTSNPPTAVYSQNTLDVFWGNSSIDKAAIELTLVYFDGSQYQSRKWYIDHNFTRTPDNNFDKVACQGGYHYLGSNNYQCGKKLGDNSGINNAPLPAAGLVLIRARLLYNTTSQPFAVVPNGTCGTACSLPSQGNIFTATGTSGQTQRKIQVFRLDKVVPFYFDYAIFSAGPINK